MASVKKMAAIIINKKMVKDYGALKTALENNDITLAKENLALLEEAFNHLKSVGNLPNRESADVVDFGEIFAECEQIFNTATQDLISK